MDKIKIGKREYSEEELERQFTEAKRLGDEEMANSPKAKKVRFEQKSNRLVIDLQNGVTMFVPAQLVQIFQGAGNEEIADVEILLNGLYLRWRRLDEDLSVPNLVSGIFGTKTWMENLSEHLAQIGRKGGASRSEAKQKASAENGKKGGRPKKVA